MPATFTELLARRSNRRQPAMQWTPVDEPSGPLVGFLTLHNDRNTCEYRVEEFPADGARGFCLLKLLPGTDITESHYCVEVRRDGTAGCDCRGNVAHGHCRHVDGVLACIENRWL